MTKGGALVRFHDWRTARDHKAATRHFWRCRCIGLVVVPVSIDAKQQRPTTASRRAARVGATAFPARPWSDAWFAETRNTSAAAA